MFAIRAIASTCVRLPSGALTGSEPQVCARRACDRSDRDRRYRTDGELHGAARLADLEGIGFGAFLASAQAYMAENTVEATRGAAIGFFSMTGGIGNTLAPLMLGDRRDVFGLASVYISSAGCCNWTVAICWIWFRLPGPSYALSYC